MKKDAYYFSHDANATNDPKIMVMIAQWGLEAYGIFWVLIEHLREQPGFKSHLLILKALALRHSSSEEKFKHVVFDFGLFEIMQDTFFYSKSLIDRMKPLEDKREKMKELAYKRWNKTDAHAMPTHINTHSEGNASKVKESKVKESKVKERNNDAKHLFCRSPYFEKEIFIQSFDEKYRVYDLEYYYEILKNYSESHGKMYNNWLAAARNWLIRDINDGKAHKINSSLTDDQQKSERLKAVQQAFEKLNQGNNGN